MDTPFRWSPSSVSAGADMSSDNGSCTVITLISPGGRKHLADIRPESKALCLHFAGKKAVLPDGKERPWGHASVVAGMIRVLSDQAYSDELHNGGPGSEARFWKKVTNAGKYGVANVQEDGDQLFRRAGEALQAGKIASWRAYLRKALKDAVQGIPGMSGEDVLQIFNEVVVERVMEA